MKKIFGAILVLLLAVSFLAACCPLCNLPAEFRLTNVTISPAAPIGNDTVIISATITNVGEQSGSCEVDLTIDGYTDSKSVSSLAGGASSSVSFSYTVTTEGSYTVTITTPDDTAIRNFAVMSGDEERFKALPGWTTGWVYECSANDASTENQTLNDTGISSIQNQTFVVASKDSVLSQYEDSNRTFENFTFSDGITVYWYQRMIGNITVEGDFINYQVDTRTGVLLRNLTHWCNNLSEDAPNITITKEQAENITGGEASLFYIDPKSYVFSAIQPVPQDPCWVSCKRDSNGTLYNITVISAQDGAILGYGFPPPSPSFVYLGAAVQDVNCSDDIFWPSFYKNAQQWFETMGYSPTNITWPTTDDIKNSIQNSDTTLFYGIAHGNGYSIICGCHQSYTASNVKDWLQNYPPIPFVYLQSCDSMAGYNTPGTFGYEFRKGLSTGTVIVGHKGLGQANLTDWLATGPWQDNFFSSMANGSTVGEAYNRANYIFPNSTPYVKFAGDSNLRLVPKVSRCVDIGAPAIDRLSADEGGYTYIQKENPADASGTINFVEIQAKEPLGKCKVGTFYLTGTNTLKCRSVAYIGDVPAGLPRTFSNLSLTVEAGDYIGIYFTGIYINGTFFTGWIDAGPGDVGIWWSNSDECWVAKDPSYPGVTYHFQGLHAISLYGAACGAPPIVVGTVTGEIRDVNGDLLTNITVTLYKKGSSTPVATTNTGSGSNYTFTVNETGEYWLVASG